MKSSLDVATINLMASILCFGMAVRHWMFYLPVGQITTEMGVVQPIIGVWLIPVTASLGMFYYFGRNPPYLGSYHLSRIVGIGMIPIVISFFRDDLVYLVTYSIYDASARPSFLILLPIALSVLISQIPRYRYYILVVSLISVLIQTQDNFILHYFIVFTMFSIFAERLHRLTTGGKFKTALVAMAYPLSVFLMFNFSSARVNMLLEILAAVGFLYTIFFVACLARQLVYFNYSLSFGIFNFYVSQALIFTSIRPLIDHQSQLNSIFLIPPAVFLCSVLLSLLIKVLEGIVRRILSRAINS